MTLTLREATANDSSALAEVWNRHYPNQPIGSEHFDFSAHRYLLALLARDVPAGYLKISQSKREGDPEGKVWAYPLVAHADEEEVMRALYGGLETLSGVHVIFTMTHESHVQRQEVLTSLGYSESLRSYGAELEVATSDLSDLDDPETRLEAEGITLYTLAELQGDADHLDKLYSLYLGSNCDVPEVGHTVTMTCRAFEAHLNRKDALPEAYHIATYGGLYIGYSELFRGSETLLRQETTAVLTRYRRRGVALALKLRGLTYAQTHGYTHIHTGMASNNAAMVALNTRLGFVPQAAYITFCKHV